ncbi:regulator of volume decrease after cellular swelling-domain-containing protein [Phaeosphaeria sp. MPI-PUGE-AT-0046c]|nr:regulator of volume decrease after cellular swelling-domain-containing protein [Phaeosphaeria sp. MPI-PUGE-AT-0046c]
MAIRHLDSAPKTEDYTPLQEHQEQTPTTFFGSKPVVYARYAGLTLSAPASQLQQDAAFYRFNTETEGEDALIKDVEIWVNSENLTFFQTTPTATGVAIPYPSIALHATMKYKSTVEAVYMNLSLNDPETVNEEEDIQTLELTVLPPNYSTNPDTACIKEIFNAMNTCADLHPDPDASGDEDGEDILDDSAPGASGWITAENMDQYMDENGNFAGMVIGDDELGPGAGTVRTRDEGDEGANGVNGTDGHEGKYHRTG